MQERKKRNPFAHADGTPKKGKEENFFQFERDQLPGNRNEIPKSDGQIMVDEEKALGEQMDTDPEA